MVSKQVWQYITLMKRIFLIDCPGIVYDTGDDEVRTSTRHCQSFAHSAAPSCLPSSARRPM